MDGWRQICEFFGGTSRLTASGFARGDIGGFAKGIHTKMVKTMLFGDLEKNPLSQKITKIDDFVDFYE